jgi:uncharacterized repeat protein (TIGR01451 family)
MAASNKKFTQRLSVRLGVVFSIIALGAIAIAHGQWTGDRSPTEPASLAASTPAPPAPDAIQPIPMPEDEPTAPPAASRWDSSQRFATLPKAPAMPPEPAGSTLRFHSETDTPIIRGKEDDPSDEPSLVSRQQDDRYAELPEVPDRPSFDEPQRLDPELASGTPLAVAESRASADDFPAAATQYQMPDLPSQSSVYGNSQPVDETTETSLAPPVRDQPDEPPSASLQSPRPQASSSNDLPDLPAAPASSSGKNRWGDALEDQPPGRFDPPAMPDSSVAPLQPDLPEPSTAEAESQPLRFSASTTSNQRSNAPAPTVSEHSEHSPGFEGDGAPGAESLEGRQAPALTVEKIASAEIQVGKEASFQVRIRNVGQVAAHDLIVLDRVPRGTRFVNAVPQATEAPDGQLMWQLGSLAPDNETTVTMHVLPISEGEIGSVAQVLFQTHASMRTVCTRPELTVTHSGPKKVLIGESVVLDITVSNPGSGAATGVVLEENIPEGLSHPAGHELEYEVGILEPGESRRLQLTLKAAEPGVVENTVYLRGDGNLVAEDTITMEVVAPSLQVSLTGPRLRYLEREAIYDVNVANPGTATAHDIELVTYLPKGMQFVDADHKGQYEPQNHAVYWSLEELPPQQSGVAKLTLLPLETGQQRLNVEGRAEMGLKDASEKLVQVDGLAELQFSIHDEADPIEEGSETSYVIQLNNRGSSAATDIRMQIGLPPEIRPIGGEGPTQVSIEGPRVSVDPLARLGPGEKAEYRIRVRGLAAGAHRLQVQLISQETPVPVTKEEATRVYADR